MEQVILEARRRTPGTKGAARSLRREGLVPGVVYGHRLDPMPIAVEARTLAKLLRHHRSGNVLFDLTVDGQAPGEYKAIVKELQADPVSDQLLSVDFQWVSLTERVHVVVPVRVEGMAAGVKSGGMLEQMLHEVQVSCLPTNIPEEIVVDVTPMEQGDSLHVSDIAAPEGVTILTHAEDTVVSVRVPHVAPVVAEVEGEEAVEEGEEAAEGQEAEERGRVGPDQRSQ